MLALKAIFPVVLASVFQSLCVADENVLEPFSEESKWNTGAHGEGATLVRSGRSGSAIVIEGTGTGLIGESPGFGYAAQSVELFDRAITAELVALDAGDGSSAGISIRELSPAGEPTVFMDLIYTSDGKLHRQGWTWSFDGVPDPVVLDGISLPVWLQVEYIGGGLCTSWSRDGVDWQEFGDYIPGTLHPEVRPMLTVASGSAVDVACAGFDNIWISGGDADENNIYDGWEMLKFGRLVGEGADNDLDGDLISVRDEWLTGRDPFEPESPAQLLIELADKGQIEVSLEDTALPWKLEAADSLDSSWLQIDSAYGRSILVSASEQRRFFRARFSPPGMDPLPFELQLRR